MLLAVSSTPLPFKSSKATAQVADKAILKRQLPPYADLPNLENLLTEGKNLHRVVPPQPPLKPSTLCGHVDSACKEKKEKKVGQNFTPSGDKARLQSASAIQPEKNSGNWLSRFGRKVSGAFARSTSGFTTPDSGSKSFRASSAEYSSAEHKIAGQQPVALAARAVPVAPPPPAFGGIIEALLDPRYRVGGAGEDLFSGNFNFSLPLLSLPGRAGLGLNLTLSCNSVIWAKYGNAITFDYFARPSLSPGFRLGLPEIFGPYQRTSSNDTYIVMLPSGQLVELRQTAPGAATYESIDSSYLWLDTNTSASEMTLYTTGGTQFRFQKEPLSAPTNQSRCNRIRDNNGVITHGLESARNGRTGIPIKSTRA